MRSIQGYKQFRGPLNARVVRELQIGVLFSPLDSVIGSTFPDLATEYDQIQGLAYEPFAKTPRVASSAAGGGARFFNTGSSKNVTTGRGLVCRDAMPASRSPVTNFCVASSLSVGTSVKGLIISGFSLRYQANPNVFGVQIAATPYFFSLPAPNDFGFHTWAGSYDPDGASPRIKVYFDGLLIGTAAGPTSDQVGPNVVVGGATGSEASGWYGDILMAGSSKSLWTDEDHMRFHSNPFEVHTREGRRRVKPFGVNGQIDSRDFEILPVVGSSSLEVSPAVEDRDLEIESTVSSSSLEVSPTVEDRDIQTVPVIGSGGSS